jgi:membrane dipeptidase
MNELGMLVDLSHAGRRSFFDALEASARPVIASHSGCSAVNDHPRNLDDEQLRALAEAGGVVGIVFCTAFLDSDAYAEDRRVVESEAYKALAEGRDSTDTGVFLAQSELIQREARPLSIERVADHVCHAVEVAGIDHVGLGSDYDGIQRTPAGLEDVSCYPRLAEALERRGYELDDIRKVFAGNMRRAFAEATGPGTRAREAGLEPLAT